jgi:hypothetical protein
MITVVLTNMLDEAYDKYYGEKITLLSDVLDTPGLKSFSFAKNLKRTD